MGVRGGGATSLRSSSMIRSIRLSSAAEENRSTSIMPPPPNLKQDLRRLGLEYTGADMSLSALFLHELHHRSSSHNYHRRQPNNMAASAATGDSLNDLTEEEYMPLVD